MSGIIKLLPESIANQIAAGEVVQRPSSVVKELLENAVDSGADSISLVIKNSGKTLVMVTDNGVGMDEEDVEMCIQRHATSKIKTSKDLFSIKTMGFRGEAIASICAISHTEIKSKPEVNEAGTLLRVEGGEIKKKESCAMSGGTSISVMNLFYNVPARRNFLKSDQVELRHIIEEFQRIALSHPDISFKMSNNDQEVYNLNKGAFRQRISAVFGNKYNERLVPVKEATEVVNLSGFVSKPEYARKVRGEQFFFVNDRFVKSGYLHHAVKNAFQELIPDDSYPSYFLKLEIEPSKIDINIHPTKTEVKFEEEKSIYAIIRTSVRQALGKFNISPTLDFEQESSFNIPPLRKGQEVKIPEIQVNPDYNPFNTQTQSKSSGYSSPSKQSQKSENWEHIFEEAPQEQQLISPSWEEEASIEQKDPVQLNNRYIISIIKSGLLVIDQHRAHIRVLYDNFTNNINIQGQRLAFPEILELSSNDFTIALELIPELNNKGFDIEEFGRNTLKINALPSGMRSNLKTEQLIEGFINDFKSMSGHVSDNIKEHLTLAICKKLAIPYGKQLKKEEMKRLIDELFASQSPNSLPDGKRITTTMATSDLAKKFE